MSLTPTPEYDRAGFCCLCHTQIADFEGQRIVKIHSSARPTYVRLNDGSMMNIVTCATCKDNMTSDDMPKIMESVYKGWKADIAKLVVDGKWAKDRADEHLEAYGAKHIIECDEKGLREHKLISELGKLEGPLEKEKRILREKK